MPLIDRNLPVETIEQLAYVYDVDALYLDTIEGELAEWLRKSCWGWPGRGTWGPFGAAEGGFRKGLLPAHLVDVERDRLLVPEWSSSDPLTLAYSAMFGSNDNDLVACCTDLAPNSGTVGFDWLNAAGELTSSQVGTIQITRAGFAFAGRGPSTSLTGAVVAREGHPEDVVRFWNLRSFGGSVLCVPNNAPDDVLTFLAREQLPGVETRTGGPEPKVTRRLLVWGLEHADDAAAETLAGIGARLGLAVTETDRSGGRGADAFPGLKTRHTSSFRAEFPPNVQVVTVPVPTVPLVAEANTVMPGIVAVDVTVDQATNLDPRLTASVPPYRRHSDLLGRARLLDVDHFRVLAQGTGFAFGAHASHDEVAVVLPSNLDVVRVFFDDDQLQVSQSDDGRFQTRAAQMLGGPFGNVVSHPGVRAAIDRAARSASGMTLQQLRATVKSHQGHWPDPFYRGTSEEYAKATVDRLLHSGLFVPMLDVHCSNCRVESQISPRDLDATLVCEFCGDTFRLALSLSLSRSKAPWRYRLASHLRSERVKALLPALATMSVLGELESRSGPPSANAFGVQFDLSDGKQIEVDVVTYFAAPCWAVALGEVKNGNRIDANDVANLEHLQSLLDAKGVRSLLVFATLKEALLPSEVEALRAYVERSGAMSTSTGELIPRWPLVLTGQDLSVPWGSEEHPWRWDGPRAGLGVFGTAEGSCRRNLGLEAYEFLAEVGDQEITYQWASTAT